MTPGDAFRVHLERGKGSEQHGSRPVIVVQALATGFNSTRLCAPTSRSAALLSWRVEVDIEGQRTVALTEQARALSIERLNRPAGRITTDELRDIVARIRQLLPSDQPT